MNLLEQEPQSQDTSYPEVFRDEHGEFCLIPLTHHRFAAVSAHRYEHLNQWKWHAYWDKQRELFIARRTHHYPKAENKSPITILMARFIMTAEKGVLVDHKDCNTLNNRDHNLRVATRNQNQHNARKRATNTSGYKCVSWAKDRNRWLAYTTVNRKRFSLGYFKTAEEAYAAYCKSIPNFHGEFSRTQ